MAAIASRRRADGRPVPAGREETAAGLRLNTPAGHLDPGESPQQAVVRRRWRAARVFAEGLRRRLPDPHRPGRRHGRRDLPAPGLRRHGRRARPGSRPRPRHRRHALDDPGGAARQPGAASQPAGAALRRGRRRRPAPSPRHRLHRPGCSGRLPPSGTAVRGRRYHASPHGRHPSTRKQHIVVGLSGGVDSAIWPGCSNAPATGGRHLHEELGGGRR